MVDKILRRYNEIGGVELLVVEKSVIRYIGIDSVELLVVERISLKAKMIFDYIEVFLE